MLGFHCDEAPDAACDRLACQALSLPDLLQNWALVIPACRVPILQFTAAENRGGQGGDEPGDGRTRLDRG